MPCPALLSSDLTCPVLRQAAETELGVARLLDPEDVDVSEPDEKSVMTYVAQFLHKFPKPGALRQVGSFEQQRPSAGRSPSRDKEFRYAAKTSSGRFDRQRFFGISRLIEIYCKDLARI